MRRIKLIPCLITLFRWVCFEVDWLSCWHQGSRCLLEFCISTKRFLASVARFMGTERF
uniref:Uncharacterized protein n=1 Tax=Brassica oleracea TaxID=3712 RepID=A0A3P6FAN6_BRAOL|nr:unnamed protein product [Brassica oleracea]